jgi:hypothetical protein
MYNRTHISSVSVDRFSHIKSLKIMILFTVNNVKNSRCLCHESVSVIQVTRKFETVNESELPSEQ